MRFQDHLFCCPNIFRSSSVDVFVERINLSWLGCPYYKQKLNFTYLQRTVFNGDNNVMFQAINLLGDQVARITSSGMSLHQKWQIEFWTMYSLHNLINKARSRGARWVFIYTRISTHNRRWRSRQVHKFDRTLVRGGTPRNSWWGCVAQFSESWPNFRTKKCHFLHLFSDFQAFKIHIRFQTCPLINYAIIT